MAVTTYRSFVDALEALTITGVSKQYTQGPPVGSPTTDDCPAQFVRYPGSDEHAIVFGEQLGWPTLRADLVVLVEPVGQNLGGENFDATVDMMDAVAIALRGAPCITKSHLRVSMRQTIEEVAGQAYWAVVANVEGNG